MSDTLVEAPKMFREMNGIRLENVRLPFAQETLWALPQRAAAQRAGRQGRLHFHARRKHPHRGLRTKRQLSFQYCRNVVIRNAVINSKDAFWNTEDVTVYDSEINGEYLGWHSKRLRLVNCKISGTQPLCYATDLVMENCTMADDCDLAFEYSTLQAAIDGPVRSVKNPRSGSLTAESYGEVHLDGNVKHRATAVSQRGTNKATAHSWNAISMPGNGASGIFFVNSEQNNNAMKKIWAYILPTALCFVLGGLAGWLQQDAIEEWYPLLDKPTAVTAQCGFSKSHGASLPLHGYLGRLVLTSEAPARKSAVRLWFLQLGCNFLWSILFFVCRSPLLGMVDIVALDVLVILYLVRSANVRAAAAWLFVPYLCWLLFATYLNAYILVANGTGL